MTRDTVEKLWREVAATGNITQGMKTAHSVLNFLGPPDPKRIGCARNSKA